jgi:hypothetical protein
VGWPHGRHSRCSTGFSAKEGVIVTWEEQVRRRAEGLRRVATVVMSADSRAAFLCLADEYDCLADELMAQPTPASIAASPSWRARHRAASERWAGLGDQ